MTSGPPSDVSEHDETPDTGDSEASSPRELNLLLDLSKAVILPGPLSKGHDVQQQPRIPFEAATAMRERLGRNDIWALTTDGSLPLIIS